MKRIEVALGARSYPVYVGSGVLGRPDLLAGHLPTGKLLIVSNETVAPLHLDRLRGALSDRPFDTLILPDGEQHKTLATAARVIDALVQQGCGRDGAVLALGGGVVGDISGFAAACYQRGIDVIQIPTSLLAQVDAAVGGKTAVNHPRGKNLIGAFHQPRAVLADIDTLATLPKRELRAGLAEVIKHGLIADPEFFAWIETQAARLTTGAPEALTHAVVRSCEIKASIVAADEREAGQRALLNLGHTFAHAIETATDYRLWLHGEAVAAGLALAASLSQHEGMLDAQSRQRIVHLLQACGLPVAPPPVSGTHLLEIMQHDKKKRGERLRLVLLEAIGHAVISDTTELASLQRVLEDAGSTTV